MKTGTKVTETAQIEKTARKRGAQSTQLRDILEDEIAEEEELPEALPEEKPVDQKTELKTSQQLLGVREAYFRNDLLQA